ncbi:MAG: SIS domain-containing protein [Armatimonadetes bacterium]|nr:SIS domain-containing protein [Armatimonadota bacterium]
MDFGTAYRLILGELEGALGQVSEAQVHALRRLVSEARAVFVTGEGRSGLVGRCFAMRLLHLGLRAHVVGGTTTPAFGEGDVLVAVSGSGETDLTRAVARLAAEAGGKVVVVTSAGGSPLAALANVTLLIGAGAESGTSAQYGRSLFEQSALIVLDAVAMQLERETGRGRDEMDARHANLE